MKAQWNHRLQQLQHAHLARTLRISGVGPEADTPSGRKLIFCSNDYLGLSASPTVARAATAELERGVGAGASRLVSGNFPWHDTLEHEFADFVGKSRSVLFPSGYQANVGAISALTDQSDMIFSDRLCHASIIDGCRLSRARVEIFDHNDVDHLRRLLSRYDQPNTGKLVITEGIFSMDGDMPPLTDICDVALDAGAAVYLDEAHSLGIVGPEGRGLAAELHLEKQIDVLIGTFGKAVGVAGACVACDPTVAMLLTSAARSLMYTTASPPALSRAVCASLSCVARANPEREQLRTNIRLFKSLAQKASIPLFPSDSPIQPVLIGNAARTMAISSELWERGIFVQGIRPPTVPAGTERLRITLCAGHTEEQMERLIKELKNCGVGQ